jgi:hypothetical protein
MGLALAPVFTDAHKHPSNVAPRREIHPVLSFFSLFFKRNTPVLSFPNSIPYYSSNEALMRL